MEKRTTMTKENNTCVFFTNSPRSIYNLSLIVSLYTFKDNNNLQANWTFLSKLQFKGSAFGHKGQQDTVSAAAS